jgi:hypothetical protein
VVDLEADYYWTIPLPDTFERHDQPTELEAGQLSDDLVELQELLTREDADVIVWHDLGHLVGILQRIASLDLPSSGAQT